MIPASHNTLTYLPAVGLARLLTPFIRCQSASLAEQYLVGGCRLLDIRVAFDRAGNPWPAHGLARFGTAQSIANALTFLECQAHRGTRPIYVRIILERGSSSSATVGLFRSFCRTILTDYPSLRFIGGRAKKGWKLLFVFPTAEPEVTDAYASYHGGSSHPILGLFPRLWARRHNPSNRLLPLPGYLLQDFITRY